MVLDVLGLTLLTVFAPSALHGEPVVVALCGATAMLLVTDVQIEKALEWVEWATLFFSIGLFVMVGALEQQGVIGRIPDGVEGLTGGSTTVEAVVILWGAALGSALVENIPFTAAMIPVVDQLDGPEIVPVLWWALALGACFGGNATLVAAAANVAATGSEKREGAPDLVPALPRPQAAGDPGVTRDRHGAGAARAALMRPAGFEPAASRLEVSRSIP